MVEDFYNDTNDTALSSVGVQFIIQIIDSTACFSKPQISSNVSSNSTVTVGQTYQFIVIVNSDCPGVSIVEFFRTPPVNMYKSNITSDIANNRSTITETWTPTIDQSGSQVYCTRATDRYALYLFIKLSIYVYLFDKLLVLQYNLIHIV
jgi:hypothetical protein